jgi:hypothetical protein
MTRKKHREKPAVKSAELSTPAASAAVPAEPPPAETANGPQSAAPQSAAPSARPAEPLLDEVQTFLSRRAELAQKLADEIAATEQRLVELKQTAAMLFPESATPTAAKDRKPKKTKSKPVPREEKVSPSPVDAAAASDAAA